MLVVKFDPTNPLATDPSLEGVYPNDYAWGKSKQTTNVYYSWVQSTANHVALNEEPKRIDLDFGVELAIYRGAHKQELLYRILFKGGLPPRLVLKPSPYCIFWSWGEEGGPASRIKYHYRDRYLTLHEWTDKRSFLGILRQQHYESNTNKFWSRASG